MNVSERIAKLRRMADHPTSNPHEAAIARAELDKLEREHPRHLHPVVEGERFPEWAADASCYICGIRLNPGWAFDISPSRCPAHLEWKCPGDRGYYEWARQRSIGDVLRVRNSREDVSPTTPPRFVEIVRMTSTQYIMSDGSRFRRSGRFPGCKVGNGGRAFLICATPEGSAKGSTPDRGGDL